MSPARFLLPVIMGFVFPDALNYALQTVPHHFVDLHDRTKAPFIPVFSKRSCGDKTRGKSILVVPEKPRWFKLYVPNGAANSLFPRRSYFRMFNSGYCKFLRIILNPGGSYLFIYFITTIRLQWLSKLTVQFKDN